MAGAAVDASVTSPSRRDVPGFTGSELDTMTKITGSGFA